MTPLPTILLTGATGTLGPTVLPRLLHHGSVVALLRPGGESAERRFDALLAAVRREDPETPVDRLSVVAGDLSRPGAGLALEDRRRLARDVTHVLHLAADTRFSLPLREARTGNVDTTLELLRVVESFEGLLGFGFVSTLYVAGTRTGEIREEELADSTFVNTYERAKFEAERALRDRMPELPIAVFRVATLLGSARTGEVRKPTAIHQALRLYHRGLVPMVPGDPAQPVELLDVEHAAEAVARLLTERFAPGSTYHVTAGPAETLSLGELIEEAHRGFGELDAAWKRRGIEPPPVVRARTYALFERTVEEAADAAMVAVVRTLSTFLPQLLYPKRFTRTHIEAALPDWHPPPVREYLRRVLAHCLLTRWGRNREGRRSERAIALL
jgi:nucleoside-diphosphate-sugar epimerase